MSEQQKHINHYSLTDIEQYLQGKLSPSAMHELEKAALQDPFLADAIEGYRETNLETANKDLSMIDQQLLLEEALIEETVSIPSKQNQWLRIAALFILIAGAGASALYFINGNSKKNNLVQQSVNLIKKDSQSASTAILIKKDTITIIAKQTQNLITKKQDNALARNRDTETNFNNHLGSKDKQFSGLVAANNIHSGSLLTSNNSLSNAKDPAPISLAGSVSGINTSLSIDSSQEKSKERNVLIDQKVFLGSNNLKAVGSSIGKGKIDSLSLLAPLTEVITVGKGNLNKPLKESASKPLSYAPNIIVTNANPAAGTVSTTTTAPKFVSGKTTVPDNTLSEVVVTGYPTQRKKDLTGSVAFIVPPKTETDTLVLVEGNFVSIAPEGGRKAFSDYLINQIVMNANIKKTPGQYGLLELKLTINEIGKITKVKIIRSFDKKLNKILTKAIMDGPVWISPKKEKTSFGLTILL